MAAAPGDPVGYFRCTSRFWMGVIAISIGYFAWAVFLPSTIPYENLGPFGHFTKYLVDNHPKLLYNGTKGITDSSVQRRWFIQTFLFGIASLSHLLAYKPPPKKQR
ncbi:transmembrane protein 254-like isoform X1 [Terrapene carolina triunguis]|uniref:transmembrane protein 254-like isoform X1 n=1 Tax=Terrapene triunguis TaxID=2587831 RepID=UPI000E77B2BF|nr:transmembrane protein 254-like isoform X1 [Terrapene carolina triunguis]